MASIDWSSLSHEDLELLRLALAAACCGPFFEDSEFGTLMGVTRSEMGEVLGALSTTPVRRPAEAPEFSGWRQTTRSLASGATP